MAKRFLTAINCPDVEITNAPTAPDHGTNKQYVDGRTVIWRGEYLAANSYTQNDLVILSGVTFIYISATPGIVETPSGGGTVWDVFMGEEEMRKEIDELPGGDIYIGKALPGELKSSAVWAIQKVTATGQDLSITWADGNSQYNKVWDSRASYSY